MLLAISNIAWKPENSASIYRLLQELNICDLEVAPSLLMNSKKPYDQIRDARHISNKLKEQYGLKIVSMQSIWYGVKDSIFSDIETQKRLTDYTEQAIDFADAINCKNLVFGCPKNRMLESSSRHDDAFMFFNAIGRLASAKGCVIALEPNPTIYGTNFLNTTAETVKFLSELDNPGIKLNLDMGAIIYNGEDLGTIKGNIDWVNHIHISEPNLVPIKRRLELHSEIMSMFSDDQIFSIEMKQVDQSIIRETIKYLQAIVPDG